MLLETNPNTGYTDERASEHDGRYVPLLLDELRQRGVDARELPVNGNNPDVRTQSWDFEVKCSYRAATGNWSIAAGSLQRCEEMAATGRPVYFSLMLGAQWAGWKFPTPQEVRAAIGDFKVRKGEDNGRGSKTSYYLFPNVSIRARTLNDIPNMPHRCMECSNLSDVTANVGAGWLCLECLSRPVLY